MIVVVIRRIADGDERPIDFVAEAPDDNGRRVRSELERARGGSACSMLVKPTMVNSFVELKTNKVFHAYRKVVQLMKIRTIMLIRRVECMTNVID